MTLSSPSPTRPWPNKAPNATANTGYPCRISLEDVKQGDELLLLPYEHQPATCPYRASGPIYVRRGAVQRVPPADEVPPYLSSCLLSERAYDNAHAIIDASVCEGTQIAEEIERVFSNPAVAYLRLHFAKRGCFACRAERHHSVAWNSATSQIRAAASLH